MPFSPVYDTLAALPLPTFDKSVFQTFQPGVSPLSTYKEVLGCLVLYLCLVFGGQHVMRDYKPFSESEARARAGRALSLCLLNLS